MSNLVYLYLVMLRSSCNHFSLFVIDTSFVPITKHDATRIFSFNVQVLNTRLVYVKLSKKFLKGLYES